MTTLRTGTGYSGASAGLYAHFSPREVSSSNINVLDRLKNIHTGFFSSRDSVLVEQLKKLEPIQLKEVLTSYFSEMVQEGKYHDSFKILDYLASVIPSEQLHQIKNNPQVSPIREAKKMLTGAQIYLNATSAIPFNLRAQLSKVLDGLLLVVENIVLGFGIGNLFEQSESEIQREFKSQKIMTLCYLFTMLMTVLAPALGAEIAGLIIGGTVLGIVALSIVWPWINPIPAFLPAKAEKWPRQIQSNVFISKARTETLEEIKRNLSIKHVILVGPSRVGKSLTAEAFAQAVERGDYPEFKGKKIFRINAGFLVGQQASYLGGGNDILTKISNAMGRHRKDIILVLDEIHAVCRKGEPLADQFKTMLDKGGAFPYVIGITTDKEYMQVQENDAFSNRFELVKVQNTDDEETEKILIHTTLTHRHMPSIGMDSIKDIYAKSIQAAPHAPQPEKSLDILNRCILRTGRYQKSETETEISRLEKKIAYCCALQVATQGKKEGFVETIEKLESDLETLKTIALEESRQRNVFFEAKEQLAQAKQVLYKTVLKIAPLIQERLGTRDKVQLNRFVLLQELLIPVLERSIQETGLKLGIKTTIDQELIDAVIAGA